ncbi:MAG: TrkA family potassium uptake protein [Planctomycetes bacterium]|nr:TrkA family potassium uptake protein [Planctomycetota bacterium]
MSTHADFSDLSRHIIICGLNGPAIPIIEVLDQHKLDTDSSRITAKFIFTHDFVVIDQNGGELEKMEVQLSNLHYIVGDPTEDTVLLQANIQEAYGIFPLLPSSKDNLFITFTAKQLNPAIRIVTSSTDIFHTTNKLFAAGANCVVSPSYIGGMRLVSELIRPHATNFLDKMLHDRESDLQILELPILEESGFAGQKLSDLALPEKYSVQIVAIVKKGTTDPLYNPPASTLIETGDILVGFGRTEAVERLQVVTSGIQTK